MIITYCSAPEYLYMHIVCYKVQTNSKLVDERKRKTFMSSKSHFELTIGTQQQQNHV
jgi:hypothetical protein